VWSLEDLGRAALERVALEALDRMQEECRGSKRDTPFPKEGMEGGFDAHTNLSSYLGYSPRMHTNSLRPFPRSDPLMASGRLRGRSSGSRNNAVRARACACQG
jgi:hypothetical protein